MFRRPLCAITAIAFTLGLAGLGGATAAGAADDATLTLPSLPIDLTLTPPTTGASQSPALPPAGVPDVDGLPAPQALPAPGAQAVPPLLPGTGGAGKTESPTDPCAEVTGPAAAQGAPVAATCPIIPASDGGVDVPICLDIAKLATCTKSASVTTTTVATDGTTPSGTGSTGSGGSGSDDPAAGSSASPTSVAVSPSSSTRGTGETLPLTGSAIVWLLTIGTACAAAGGALARVARRRFS